MQIEPLFFKEFDAESAGKATAKGVKTFLPGGRTRGAVPPPPPPSFTEEQLKAAERDGYQKGFLAGIEDGKKQMESEQAQIDRTLSRTAEKFALHIAPLLEEYHQFSLQLKDQLPKVAYAMTRKIAGAALKENAGAEIEALAERCLQVMIAEPKLTVTVNDKLAPTLEGKIRQIAERVGAAGEIVVAGDASMGATDCRIDWKHGAAGRDTERMWEELQQAAGVMAAAGKHDIENNLKLVKEKLLEATKQEIQPNTKE